MKVTRLRHSLILYSLILSLAACSLPGTPPPPAANTDTPTPEIDASDPTMAITGPMEVVYDWSVDRCASDDLPDMPLRPFRDAQGNVQANRSWPDNRRFLGPDLDSIEPLCETILESARDRDPSHYNYLTWFQSLYTEDGQTVHAILHNEHNCQDFGDQNCWYQNMAYAVSTDGGVTFQVPEPPGNLVGAIPYRYTPGAGLIGLTSGSNIVKGPDGAYYMLVMNWSYVERIPHTCLLRSDDLSDPASWRAWDGDGFDMTLINPYTETDFDPAAHDCPPVDPDIHHLGNMSDSLIYNTYLGRYVVVSLDVNWIGNETFWGINYSFSDDLIHWDTKKPLEAMTLGAHTGPGGPDGAGYLILLDPDSPSRNFETAGKTAYIYFTRFNNTSGIAFHDADLVRFPVEFFASEQEASQADVRTQIDLTQTNDGADRLFSGTLSDHAGRPIAGATVELTVAPNDDAGLPHEYMVTATVPENATGGIVGLRVNSECNCAGESELYLYEYSYAEEDGGNRVANPLFANGLSFFNSWGTAALELEPSDQGSGAMLHVSAAPQQYAGLISSDFPVTPGATFTFKVRSRVVPGSYGTGFFGLFFTADGGESLRVTIPFTIPESPLGTAVTGENGGFEFLWQDVPVGYHTVKASYPGSDRDWPSNAVWSFRVR
jgi:hypothetical protein